MTWSTYVQKAEEIFNERPNAHLLNTASNDVKGNDVLNYELEAEAGVDMKHNYDKWASRIEDLKNKGAFRTPLPRAQWEGVEQPKFAGNVHHVKTFIGTDVEDSECNSFPIK